MRPILLALLVGSVAACSGEQGDEDLRASAVCLEAVGDRTTGRVLGTVRDEGPDAWTVNAWVARTVEGDPDYVCSLVRDGGADEGFRITTIRRVS